MYLRCKMTGGEITTPQSKIKDFVQLPSQGEPRRLRRYIPPTKGFFILKMKINPINHKKEVDLIDFFGYNTLA